MLDCWVKAEILVDNVIQLINLSNLKYIYHVENPTQCQQIAVKLYDEINYVGWNDSVAVNENKNGAVLCNEKLMLRGEKMRCDNEEYWFQRQNDERYVQIKDKEVN